jgi:phage terminase small subunit
LHGGQPHFCTQAPRHAATLAPACASKSWRTCPQAFFFCPASARCPDWLPEARKAKYNWDRKSQVLVKKL